ncbi:MAG TPA: F0F1 ATP synthase subunit alpha, partial [Candidatus Bathyarchaeia archaeon]|nr:F0F1 ATP synthase subunit alpha [Candidatus Bathyarchaeia archaeon]
MELKNTDLVSLFERSLKKQEPVSALEQIGIVIKVSDNICIVYGLEQVQLHELIMFEGGNQGIAFELDIDAVSVFLFYDTFPVAEQTVAKRTGKLLLIPVGSALLGRTIHPLGHPLDGLGTFEPEDFLPLEAPIASVIERSPVNESLETGIIAIDTLVPIGKGQRELLIGN